MDDSVYFRALAAGFDVPADAADLVLVDTLGDAGLDRGVRVGMLARLLSMGEDWGAVTTATGFALEVRPAARPIGRLLIEFGQALLPFDVFAFAADPLAAITRMFQAAEGRP